MDSSLRYREKKRTEKQKRLLEDNEIMFKISAEVHPVKCQRFQLQCLVILQIFYFHFKFKLIITHYTTSLKPQACSKTDDINSYFIYNSQDYHYFLD